MTVNEILSMRAKKMATMEPLPQVILLRQGDWDELLADMWPGAAPASRPGASVEGAGIPVRLAP